MTMLLFGLLVFVCGWLSSYLHFYFSVEKPLKKESEELHKMLEQTSGLLVRARQDCHSLMRTVELYERRMPLQVENVRDEFPAYRKLSVVKGGK